MLFSWTRARYKERQQSREAHHCQIRSHLPETLGGLLREDAAQLGPLVGNCVSFHWGAHPFGMLLTHELPAWNDLYL